ncbi:MAG: AMIN domain-containing protein [Proteobacteria bacterium]|nr:AMIN domain-containing protein [Pseudomonadota bacterium]
MKKFIAVMLLLVFMVAVVGGLFVPPVTGRAQDSAAPESHGSGLVEKMRVGQDGGRTRIVLEFAGDMTRKDIDYRWFTLPDPARVVVDFGDINFVTAPNLLDLPPTSLVKGMRAGRFRPGTVRMVLDLDKPGRVNVFTIPAGPEKGARLVIDVLTVGPGQKPTDIPPPADVVEQGKAPAVTPAQKANETAPVVPRQVVKTKRDHMVVVLDPGHGGVDPGACGKTIHLCEKNLTLTMAKLVRDKLQSDRVQVILTRDSDVYIPLPDRPKVAQEHNADVFVSLHADIHPTDRSVKGATVYMVSEKSSDREAARLADSENAGDILAGVGLEKENLEVRNILISLVQRDTMNNSAYLGQGLLNEVDTVTDVRKKHLLFAGFRVLKAPDVPSVLVEMGYLSNRTEERQLDSSKFRNQLAEAIASGIKDYLNQHVHY